MAWDGKHSNFAAVLAASGQTWGTEQAIGAGSGIAVPSIDFPFGSPAAKAEETTDTPFPAYMENGNVDPIEFSPELALRATSSTSKSPVDQMLMAALYNATTATQQGLTAAYLHTGTISSNHAIAYLPTRWFTLARRDEKSSGYAYLSIPSALVAGFTLSSAAGEALKFTPKLICNKVVKDSATNGATQWGAVTYLDKARKYQHHHLSTNSESGVWFAKSASEGSAPVTFDATTLVHPSELTIEYDPKLSGYHTDSRYSERPEGDGMGSIKVTLKFPKMLDAFYAGILADLKNWESDTESYYHLRARWTWGSVIASTYYPYIEVGLPRLRPVEAKFAVEAGKRIPLELTFEALAPTAYSHLPTCFQYVGGASGTAFDPIYIAIMNQTSTALIA